MWLGDRKRGAGMRNRWSHGRVVRVLMFAGVVALLCLAMGTLALAAWPDTPWEKTAPYGIYSDQDLEAISQGFPDGLWRPDAPLSRAQFAKMAIRAFEFSAVTPAIPSFSDVPPTDQFYTDIETAVSSGLMQGRGDRTFDPTATVTRGEAVAVVGRGLAYARGVALSDYYTLARIQDIVLGFLDGATVPSSLAESVAYAVEKGVARGGGDGRLNPLGTITRLQGAALLVRVMQLQASFGETVPYYATTWVHVPTTGSGRATLSGTATDEEGNGVFGYARLMDVQGNVVDWAYLDYTSGYSFAGLAPGDYRMRVGSPWYVGEYYDGLPTQTYDVSESNVIRIGESDVRADFALAKGYSLSGHCVIAGFDPTGVMQSWGDQLPTDEPGPWIVQNLQLLDANGRDVHFGYFESGLDHFVFWGLMPGRYKLKASAAVSSGKSAEVWYPAAHSSEEAGWIDLTAGDVTDIDVYLGVLPVGQVSSTTTGTTIPPQ
jgi:hypothetical protein